MLNCDRKPSLLVITDIDEVRLKRASELFTEEYAKERGVEIHFVNTAKVDDPVKALRDLTGGTGFDDVCEKIYLMKYLQEIKEYAVEAFNTDKDNYQKYKNSTCSPARTFSASGG